MKPRIIFIHGNGSMSWKFAWTPWLKEELEAAGYSTFFETFPDSIIARAEYWLDFLENYVKAGPDDLLVGWSSGAVAAMRYAETHQIRGSVLVAPSYTDLGDSLEKQSGYFDTPWNWQAIRANQNKIALFHTDNDPFIPIAQSQHIAANLQPDVIKIPGAGHFIEQSVFPELLDYVKKNFV